MPKKPLRCFTKEANDGHMYTTCIEGQKKPKTKRADKIELKKKPNNVVKSKAKMVAPRKFKVKAPPPPKKEKPKRNFKVKAKLPKFLGHVGSPHATDADRWYLENEEKPRIKKLYVEFTDESMVKQGLNPKSKDFNYSLKQYEIAADYADGKMRKWYKNNVAKK